jgi:hypothetical protein
VCGTFCIKISAKTAHDDFVFKLTGCHSLSNSVIARSASEAWQDEAIHISLSLSVMQVSFRRCEECKQSEARRSNPEKYHKQPKHVNTKTVSLIINDTFCYCKLWIATLTSSARNDGVGT